MIRCSAVRCHDFGHGLDRIQDARGRLAVHDGHVGDVPVLAQPVVDGLGVDLLVLAPLESLHRPPHDAGDLTMRVP